MTNYNTVKIGKQKVTLWFDTKHHQWKIYFNTPVYRKDFANPDLAFTKARGKAVVKFINELLDRLKTPDTHT